MKKYIKTKSNKMHLDELGTQNNAIPEPLPMKHRALPPSFWKQPKQSVPEPPTPVLPALVPLDIKDEAQQGNSSPGEVEPPTPELTEANTDLLFSLFEGLKPQPTQAARSRRPKKSRRLRHDDPYLSSGTASYLPKIERSTGTGNNVNKSDANYSQLLNDLVVRL